MDSRWLSPLPSFFFSLAEAFDTLGAALTIDTFSFSFEKVLEPSTSRAGISFVNFTLKHFQDHHGPGTKPSLVSVCSEKSVDVLVSVLETKDSL